MRLGPALLLLLALLAAGAGLASWWLRPAPLAAADSAAAPGLVVPPRSAAQRVELRQLSLPDLLAGHSNDWRLARLQEYPEVLVIEFPDLREQGAAMNRLAAFVQKAGAPRDRLLDDRELAELIAASGDNSQSFYQGHDYTAQDLARFVMKARLQGLLLNAQEQRLQAELQAAGLLAAAGAAAAGAGAPQAVITFTATQPDDPSTPVDEGVDALRREAVLRHEMSHGRFYTRAAYREHCWRFWRETLSEAQREQLRRFLASQGYDRSDESLMVNEAQAFLMNTPDARAFSAAAVGMSDEELASLRTRFWRSLPPDADAATQPAR